MVRGPLRHGASRCCTEALALLWLLAGSAGQEHDELAEEASIARFVFNRIDGLFVLMTNPRLRIMVPDTAPGTAAGVWPWTPHAHERFQQLESDGCLRVRGLAMCLVVEEEPSEGGRIVTRHCAGCDRFLWTDIGQFRLARRANLCIAVRGCNVSLGEELVLETCSEEADGQDFKLDGSGLVQLRRRPQFHISIKGGPDRPGYLPPGAPLILGTRHPSRQEVFELSAQQQLKLRHSDTCLAVAGAIREGGPIVAKLCSNSTPPASEMFRYDRNLNFILLQEDPRFAVTTESGNMGREGDSLILGLLEGMHEL